MSDTSYIDRMEIEYAELHARYVGLKAYLDKQKAEANSRSETQAENQVSAPFKHSMEQELMYDQFYSMHGYLKTLGARIQLAKAKEGLL